MNPRPSRKKEIARRTFVYALMTISMLMLLTFLMMMVLGYQFNLRTRSVEQTGLVQYGSYPRSAQVMVDGNLVGRTNTKSNVLPGKRQFAMQLKGYEPWQKTLAIDPGTVTWLTYTRLVPTEKKISTIDSMASIDSALSSPNSRYMVTWSHDDDGLPVFTSFDFRNSDQPARTDHPINIEGLAGYSETELAKSHSYRATNWSDNSRYLVTRHSYDLDDSQKTEWLWQDIDSPGNVVNVGRLTGLDIREVTPVSAREVFVLTTGGDVRLVNIDNGSISRPLVESVYEMSLYHDDLLTFTAKRGEESVAGIWQRGIDVPIDIVTMPLASQQRVKIVGATYFHKASIAVSIDDKIMLYRGGLPRTQEAVAAFLQTGKSINFNRTVDYLQFSDNGRFLIAEDGKGFISYDLERQEVSQNIRKYHSPQLSWLDGYHVWQIDEAGEMILQEFDGVNTNKLMAAVADLDSLLTSDGKYVYGWREHNGELELRRLSMSL